MCWSTETSPSERPCNLFSVDVALAAPTLRTWYLAANPLSAMDEGAPAKAPENGLIIVDRVIFYWSELLPEPPRLTTRLEKATALASAMPALPAH